MQIVVNGRERPIKEVPPTAIINIDGEAQSVAVGINYTTRLRIPSIEMQIQDGTLQGRSEEHTSELQSRFDLVCRLLLEKKKIYIFRIYF